MSYKKYKIRDGVHIPTKEYKEGWNAIFGKKGSVLNTEESFKSKEYKMPTVSVGNLSVGGTGKSVLVDYLIKFYNQKGYF